MRGTIIGVFGVVVLIVTVLSFGLVRAVVGDPTDKGQATRAARAGAIQLQMESLRLERWLAGQAQREDVAGPFGLAVKGSRSDAATTAANGVDARAKEAGSYLGVRPTVVMLVNDEGVVLGRNGSNLMRDEDLGARHPTMLKTVAAGRTGSAVWIDPEHNEHVIASYAPIRDGETIVGAVVVGTPINDQRLAASTRADSVGLALAHQRGETFEVVAQHGTSFLPADPASILAEARGALDGDQTVPLSTLPDGFLGAAVPVQGFDATSSVVLAGVETVEIASFGTLFPVALGIFILGMILVAVGAYLIDNYVSQPISDLETGLMTVINGRTDIRFELEHKVLGGLVFQINTLLNQLLGVSEDDTDEEGRPSVAPSSSRFEAALNVDEKLVSLSIEDVEDAQALRDEAPEDYYGRLFDDYVAAKEEVGDPTDALRFTTFSDRIKGLERQLSDKHGKPFRYRVEVNGSEVVLVAVPLA